MFKYREVLDYSKKCCERYLEKFTQVNNHPYEKSRTETGTLVEDRKNDGKSNNFIIPLDLSDESFDVSKGFKDVMPRSLKELLKMLICRVVTIVLNAQNCPQKVKIRDISGDILVAETPGRGEEKVIKFIDINCICEVIVSSDELLRSILEKCP